MDLLAMIADAPVTATIEGTEYTGTYTGVVKRRPLEIGGFQEEPEVSIVFSLYDSSGIEVFSTRPAIGSQVVIGSRPYRVVRSEVDPFEIGIQLDLTTPHK
jgi:hypothetical protein